MIRDIPRLLHAVDFDVPNMARVYNCLLGGGHNFAADRAVADAVRLALPCVATLAQLNRAFLCRAVRYLAGRGVTQFLELGSGIPAVGAVHEVAQCVNPACRVVYVDHDPVVAAHTRLSLVGNRRVTMVEEDLRCPGAVLTHPDTRAQLDPGQPLGVLMAGVLPFIPDADQLAGLVAAYRDACPPGSYLVLSHLTDDVTDPVTRCQLHHLANCYQTVDGQFRVRDSATLAAWFTGTELVRPGVVPLADWRSDGIYQLEPTNPARALSHCGVARLP